MWSRVGEQRRACRLASGSVIVELFFTLASFIGVALDVADAPKLAPLERLLSRALRGVAQYM